MNTNRALVVALIVVVGLFVLFGGGAMTGESMGGGPMGMGGGVPGAAWMGGTGLMWIPAVLIVGLGALFGWGIFGKKPSSTKTTDHS